MNQKEVIYASPPDSPSPFGCFWSTLLMTAAILETRIGNKPKGTANPQDTALAGGKHLAR